MTSIALIAQSCSYFGSENIFSGLKHFRLFKISENPHTAVISRAYWINQPQSTELPPGVAGKKMSRSMFILLSNAITGGPGGLPLWLWYQGHCASPVAPVWWAHEPQTWPCDPLPPGHQKAQKTNLPFCALNFLMDPPHSSYPKFLFASFLLIFNLFHLASLMICNTSLKAF